MNVQAYIDITRNQPRAPSQIKGGTWGEIGISSSVGFDLVHASLAALCLGPPRAQGIVIYRDS
jgi:hypothetical protein